MSDSDQLAQIYERTVELINEAGEDAEFRPDYSGRGMYGSTCPAIVTGMPAVKVGILFMVGYQDVVGMDSDPGNAMFDAPTRSDSMGLDTVYY